MAVPSGEVPGPGEEGALRLLRTERRKAGTQMKQTAAGRTDFSPVPTSVVLARLIHDAPAGPVTLAWLMVHLHTRSFGIILLLLGVCGLLPVVSPIAGLLLFIPALQMIRAQPAPIFRGGLPGDPLRGTSFCGSSRCFVISIVTSGPVGPRPSKQPSARSAVSCSCSPAAFLLHFRGATSPSA